MSKLWGWGMAAALGLTALVPAAASAAVLGPDAAACAADRPAVLVRVEGFKQRTGELRVQVYGANPDDFLAKGRRLKRIDLGVTDAGPMNVCVALPGPGNYAVAVRHDLDGSGKSGWNDGGGFSRNPRITLFDLKPRYEDVVIAVGRAPKPIDVVLNYRKGLSIGPIGRAS